MSAPSVLPPSGEFKDRSAGLVAFGIFEIMMGAICALLLLGMLAAMWLLPETGEAGIGTLALPRSTLGAAGLMYGIYGASLIWLGIGSILCRRWARTLLLVLSWSWLLAGVASVVGNIVMTRLLFAKQELPAGGQLPLIISFIFMVVFFVVIPGAMVLFYRSPHVAATCVARDPATRWTDRCPLPVLTSSLWFGIGALFLVIPPIIGLSIIPAFGRLITGMPAAMVQFACAALSLYLAWATYRLKTAAWWVMLIASAVVTVSSIITFQRVDFIDIYRKLGFPQEVTEQIQEMGILTSKMITGWAIVLFLLFLVYLIWIRKYFRMGSATPAGEEHVST